VNAKSFNQLVAFVQLLAFTNNWPVLGNLLTANKSVMAKAAAPSEEEVYLGSNFSSGYEYGNCRQKFLASSSKAWEDGMKGIIAELIGAEWIFNTATEIWDAAGEVNRNGSTILIQRFISKEVAAFAERFIFV
jgi:7-cyano-7-deazaguanine synthase in queuosine biosynthesis